MDEQMIEMQTKIAFQEKMLETLNQVVVDQQTQLDKVERELSSLRRQLDAARAAAEGGHESDAGPPQSSSGRSES